MELDIIQAVRDNDKSIVQAVLEHDPLQINKQDSLYGLTPLHIAVGKGNLTMTAFLLKQPHLRWGVKDRGGRDVHDLAILAGHPDVINAIVRYRAGKSGLLRPQTAEIIQFRPR